VGRFHAYGTDQEVYPLVTCELVTAFDELWQIEAGQLNRLQILDPEGAAFSFGLLIVPMNQVYLGPNAAHEEPIILLDIELGNVDILMTEVYELSPVLVILGEVSHLDLIDDAPK
jgi:hypothetical protein